MVETGESRAIPATRAGGAGGDWVSRAGQ